MSATSPKVVDLTNKKITDNNGLFLLDFWAPWCGPCIEMENILLELANNTTDPRLADLKIGKINVDLDPVQSQEFDVHSIPSIFLVGIEGGEVKKLAKFVGLMTRSNLESSILKHL